jgi:membrane-associated protease RseP (regulator of RpoE activity)
MEPARIGNIAPDQPLASALLCPTSGVPDGGPANLQKGDRILEVNGVPVKTFIEAVLQISACPSNQPIYLKIERHPELVVVRTRHDKAFGASSIGLTRYVESVPLHLGFTTEDQVAIMADPAADRKTRDKPAAQAGLKKGDVILKITDPGQPGGPVARELKDTDDFINLILGSGGRTLTLVFQRDGKLTAVELAPRKAEDADTYQIGAQVGLQRRVAEIEPQSPAYAAGLREGDFVIGFLPDDPNSREWKSGQLFWKKTWDSTKEQHAAMQVPAEGRLVFQQRHDAVEPVQAEKLGSAMGMAWDDTVHFSGVVFMILRGLFTGDVNTKTLSGPAGIGAGIFHVASNQTFFNFLWWLGFISLNFGVFQFLPIPLLDGWHLVMVLVEKLKGSPVPMRVQEAFQYVGLLLVGALLILATKNDIMRLFFS